MTTYDPRLVTVVFLHCSHTGPDTGHPDIPCGDCHRIIDDIHNAGFQRVTATNRIVAREQLHAAANILSNSGKMLAHLVMDTREDQDRTDKIAALFRDLSDTFRKLAESET